jgi:hypothetical protein
MLFGVRAFASFFYHLAAMVLPMNWAIFCMHRNEIKYKLLFYVNNI